LPTPKRQGTRRNIPKKDEQSNNNQTTVQLMQVSVTGYMADELQASCSKSRGLFRRKAAVLPSQHLLEGMPWIHIAFKLQHVAKTNLLELDTCGCSPNVGRPT